LGTKSASIVDKTFFGGQKFAEPLPYETTVEDFITHCEQTGIDPAKVYLYYSIYYTPVSVG